MPQMQEHKGHTADHPFSGQNIEEELGCPMKCPHCENELPGKHCSSCGSLIPEDSRFCMDCGARLRDDKGTSPEQEEGFDPEDRILCPDGACTGIIEDGKCTECGKPYPEAASTGN